MSAKPITPGPTSLAVRANLRRIRRAKGLRLVDLAERLEAAGHPLAVTLISKVERGERRIDVDDLVGFAGALNVPPEVLLGGSACCSVCLGDPPVGFACRSCGASA